VSHRVNFILDQSVWQAMAKVPPGERSRLVNLAITEWFSQKKRKKSAQKMDALREELPSFSSKEVLAILRSDRGRQ
jgi:hypothetical protein